MADPKYVRLSERMASSTIADIAGGSGWSISGMDVKEFPKDNDSARRFVRNRLTAGVLEPAGKAEFDEVRETNKRMSEVASTQETAPAAPVASTGLQEAQVQEKAAEEAKKLSESRQKRTEKKKDDDEG